jgi:hypothetical protein
MFILFGRAVYPVGVSTHTTRGMPVNAGPALLPDRAPPQPPVIRSRPTDSLERKGLTVSQPVLIPLSDISLLGLSSITGRGRYSHMHQAFISSRTRCFGKEQ